MAYIIVGAFILFDLITGLIKAFKEKAYNSSVMREGLYHKAGSVLIVVFATMIDYGQTFLELGFQVPVTISACVYIVLMEIGSAYENICVINPDFSNDKLRSYFFKLSGNDKVEKE